MDLNGSKDGVEFGWRIKWPPRKIGFRGEGKGWWPICENVVGGNENGPEFGL